jgi:hypothetical protein
MLQNHSVSLDKPCPQDFMARDEIIKGTCETVLVERPFELQHAQQIEYRRSRVDFIRQPECALLGRGYQVLQKRAPFSMRNQ